MKPLNDTVSPRMSEPNFVGLSEFSDQNSNLFVPEFEEQLAVIEAALTAQQFEVLLVLSEIQNPLSQVGTTEFIASLPLAVQADVNALLFARSCADIMWESDDLTEPTPDTRVAPSADTMQLSTLEALSKQKSFAEMVQVLAQRGVTTTDKAETWWLLNLAQTDEDWAAVTTYLPDEIPVEWYIEFVEHLLPPERRAPFIERIPAFQTVKGFTRTLRKQTVPVIRRLMQDCPLAPSKSLLKQVFAVIKSQQLRLQCVEWLGLPLDESTFKSVLMKPSQHKADHVQIATVMRQLNEDVTLTPRYLLRVYGVCETLAEARWVYEAVECQHPDLEEEPPTALRVFVKKCASMDEFEELLGWHPLRLQDDEIAIEIAQQKFPDDLDRIQEWKT